MAGRVLRDSKGRFNGSTRGWQRGNKKAAVNKARLAKNNDIYVARTLKRGRFQYNVMERHVTNKELAKRVGLASLGGSLGGGGGGHLALKFYDARARAKGDSGVQVSPAFQRAGEARVAARAYRKANTIHRVRGALIKSALPLSVAMATPIAMRLALNPGYRYAVKSSGIAFSRIGKQKVNSFMRQQTFKKVNRIQQQQRAYAMRRMGRTLTTGGISRAKRNMFTNSFKITTL